MARTDTSLERFQEIVTLLTNAGWSTAPAPDLVHLLQHYFEALCRAPASPEDVRRSLCEILTFLDSPAGRDAAARQLVSDFVLTENEWEMDWSYLPSPLEDVLFDLSSGLTSLPDVGSPDLPHRLLDRCQRLHL